MDTTDFDDRRTALYRAHMDLVAEYLESRPPGSFVSKEQFSVAAAGVRVDLADLQQHLAARESPVGFWNVRKDMRWIGVIVVLSSTIRAYENYQLGT
jgi:hypothetical protein